MNTDGHGAAKPPPAGVRPTSGAETFARPTLQPFLQHCRAREVSAGEDRPAFHSIEYREELKNLSTLCNKVSALCDEKGDAFPADTNR